MIVKSMSRTAPTFHQLLQYIAADGRGVGAPLLHNLRAESNDLSAVNRAFMANAAHLPARRNGISLYHEVISLNGADAPTPAMLYDLAQHYLEERAPNCLAFGMVHSDGDHPHIHLVISANLRGRGQKHRLSKPRFAAIKRDLERYQRERYPQLTHSLVFPEAAKPTVAARSSSDRATALPVSSRGEQELVRRKQHGGNTAQRTKETLAEMVASHLAVSTSAAELRERLNSHGAELYERRGRLCGIHFRGRKYRLRTLGLAEPALERVEQIWQTSPARLGALADLLAEKTRNLIRNLGYAAEMIAVLNRVPQPVLSTAMQKRLQALERIERAKIHLSRQQLAPTR